MDRLGPQAQEAAIGARQCRRPRPHRRAQQGLRPSRRCGHHDRRRQSLPVHALSADPREPGDRDDVLDLQTWITHAAGERESYAGVPRNAETPRDHVPSDDDFMNAIKNSPQIIAYGMDFAYLTGMRLGDMLQLPIPRDPDDIYCREGKTGQLHLIEWDDVLEDLVRKILSLRKVTGMTLFATRRGQPYTVNGWESMWQRAIRKAVKDKSITRFRWHDIRAKAATDANQAGQDSQALLGHKSERQHLAYLRS